MVVIIVLWEVIDPEAMAFIDPWRQREEKNILSVPCAHVSIDSSPRAACVPGSVRALGTERGEISALASLVWRGDGHTEKHEMEGGVPQR